MNTITLKELARLNRVELETLILFLDRSGALKWEQLEQLGRLQNLTKEETKKDPLVNIYQFRLQKTFLGYQSLSTLLPIFISKPENSVELVPETIARELEAAFANGVTLVDKDETLNFISHCNTLIKTDQDYFGRYEKSYFKSYFYKFKHDYLCKLITNKKYKDEFEVQQTTKDDHEFIFITRKETNQTYHVPLKIALRFKGVKKLITDKTEYLDMERQIPDIENPFYYNYWMIRMKYFLIKNKLI